MPGGGAVQGPTQEDSHMAEESKAGGSVVGGVSELSSALAPGVHI